MPSKKVTKVLFDTSFLLKDSPDIDVIIKILHKDGYHVTFLPQSKPNLIIYIASVGFPTSNTKGLCPDIGRQNQEILRALAIIQGRASPRNALSP